LHHLIPLASIPPGALTTAEVEATMAYAENEKSAATRAAYASDWSQFQAWCHARNASPLPAHQGLVAVYLSHLADSGLRASSIDRKAAAIGYRQGMAGLEPPTNAEGVKAT
jgi:site-specific recombinase XerD